MTLLEIDHLTVGLASGAARPILDDVSLRVRRGEIVGLVGESGSGKSTTARAALGAFPGRSEVTGSVTLTGTELVGAQAGTLRSVRRQRVAMVFQDPRSAVNPVSRVGEFVTETLVHTGSVTKREAREVAVRLLTEVGIDAPEVVAQHYPHQLSGGMLQRVVIAAALATDPDLLLADEATSALDVSTQAEILALLRRLRDDRGLGLLVITHDLHLAAAFCDRVAVMYAGQIVEEQPGARLFDAPAHPYTAALLACTPHVEGGGRGTAVPGQPLSLGEERRGCGFAARCRFATDVCGAEPPVLEIGGATTRCHRAVEIAGSLGSMDGLDREGEPA
jgi:peptide/nickel transport system ATP-binding protein